MNNTPIINPPKKKAASIPVDKLHPFEGHPFQVTDNEEMESLTESIRTQGILSPLIVRPIEGKPEEYEIISGHRRLYAAKKAGIGEVPALIYPLDRNEAAIAVVDSNLHREHILPSEKAFAYKMKLDAMRQQGKRNDLTLSQVATKSDSAAEIGKSSGESRDQVFRYIRLTRLIPELLQKVDEGIIALSPAVELSYLSEDQQKILLDAMAMNDCTPSHAQSIRMKKLAGQVGQYLEIRYPSLGVRFIAIQENVDSARNSGAELMPFHNIFNEWYAAQTSKKIRAVNQMKAQQNRRVASSVPYGYKKDSDDREKWLIDEPAAEVVRHIFDLCVAGRGPMQIAKQLEREKILTPTAYYNSIGRAASNPMPENPYQWSDSTVENILANRQYTGCAVNFATTTVSYKVHKTVYRPPEEQQIIPDMQEPIIFEKQWLRVQELREHRRRPTKTGRTSLFSGLVYCPDCGAKLHFAAAKSITRNQEHFRCSNYKSGRGKCTVHFIRDVVLERIVSEAVGNLADFVRCYEPVFLYQAAKKNAAVRKTEQQRLKRTVESGKARIREIDGIISRLYEDNVSGKISDERFMKLTANYEAEQKELERTVSESENTLSEAEKQSVDLRMLLKGLREFTEMRELTPTIVNTLIERIEVHNNDKYDGHCHVKVDIYFTAVGMIDIPTEQEIRAMMEEIRNHPQEFKFTA